MGGGAGPDANRNTRGATLPFISPSTRMDGTRTTRRGSLPPPHPDCREGNHGVGDWGDLRARDAFLETRERDQQSSRLSALGLRLRPSGIHAMRYAMQSRGAPM